jgi:hypothetical protein
MIGLLVCAPMAACGGNPENNMLPVPPDQAAFQRAWNRARNKYAHSYDSRVLGEMPKELKQWTGKVLVKNTVKGQVELFVVQVSEEVAVVVYGVDPKVWADMADAGNYVEFSGVQPDHPSPRSHADELRIAGIWVLVELKLDGVSVPGRRYWFE